MATISLCMIAKNEEKNLGGCLESVKGLVDEIIVVDTGSTDGTAEIARAYGAKVCPFKWINDFAAARNESLRHATGDYILWLDADDRIPPEEREKFARWKEDLSFTEKKAYFFTVESPERGDDFLSKYALQIRAFPRVDGVRFIRRVHESVLESLNALGIPLEETDIRIKHVGYSEPEAVNRKAKRNLKMLLTALAEDPRDYVLHWHLSMTYSILGNHQKALEHARKFLEEGNWTGQGEWEVAAMLNVVRCLMALRKWSEAEREYRNILEKFPNEPMALFFAASFFIERGKSEEARELLERLQTMEFKNTRVPFPTRLARYLSELWLGNLCLLSGDEVKALEHYHRAMELLPEGELRDQYAVLGEMALKLGKNERAKDFLELALKDAPLNPYVLSNLGIAWRRLGDLRKAEEFLRRALDVDPGHFEALSNLAHLLLFSGRPQEAYDLLARALSLEPQATDLHLAISYVLISQRRIEEALPHLREVLFSLEFPVPKRVESIGHLAQIYEEVSERLKGSERNYEAFLALRISEILKGFEISLRG